MAEVKRELSELQEQYDSKIEFTDRHPEKVALLLSMKNKRSELNELPPTVVIEEVREPNPTYTKLEEQRMGLDRSLARYAGRDLALARQHDTVSAKLRTVRKTASQYQKLDDELAVADSVHDKMQSRLEFLQANVVRNQQFDHIRLLESPRVRSRIYPDEPRTLQWFFVTMSLAVVSMIVLPCLRCAWGSTVVSKGQIEDLANDVPIVIVGEIPARPIRRLLPAK